LQAEILYLEGLAVASLALFGTAAAGVILARRLRPENVMDLPAAFEMLDGSIQRYMPGLPKGYTWGEAFQVLRSKNLVADWGSMQETLSAYEAHRYGGRPVPTRGQEEVISLAMKLGGSVIGKGTKRKSAGSD
jgi:hypothetical protein